MLKHKHILKQTTLTVAGLTVEVWYKDIQNTHLAVLPPSGAVRLSVPYQTPESNAKMFVLSHLPWVKKQQAKFQNQERQSPRQYVSGESHYFEGHRYLLQVIETTDKPRVAVRNRKYIDMYVRPNTSTETKEKLMTEWYRQQLKSRAEPLMKKWQGITGLIPNSWYIKRMKTKWGTCNIAERRVWLNLELAKKELGCLEYVIAHELTHLLERHHNDRFTAHLDEFMPNWRHVRQILNDSVMSHFEFAMASD